MGRLNLTIRDVTRRATIEVDFLELDETGLQGERPIGFSGRTTMRRSEFNVGDSSVEGTKVVVGDTSTLRPSSKVTQAGGGGDRDRMRHPVRR